MINRIKNSIKGRLRGLFAKQYYKTYSQSGEDLILDTACHVLDIPMPTYLDIGAHEPCKLSNTYLFYEKGCSGVLVEPNPILASKLRAKRPRDKILQCGVWPTPVYEADFFVMSPSTLSTFSEREAEAAAKVDGIRIISRAKIPVLTIAQIVDAEFSGKVPDLISMDIEGLDEAIVCSNNWEELRPPILCIETREFAPDGTGVRLSKVTDRLLAAEYAIFGQTYYNSIYVDRRVFAYS